MQTEVVIKQAAAISDLLKHKNTAEYGAAEQDFTGLLRGCSIDMLEKALILKNFKVGRLVSEACREFGEEIIPEITATLRADGMSLFDDTLDKSRSVYESYRTEQRLLEVGEKLGSHFSWSFLTKQCFKPMGSARVADLYVHAVISQAERAIGAVEDLLVSDLPDELKEQAVSLAPYITGHAAAVAAANSYDCPGKRTLKVLHTGDLHYREKGLADIKKSGDFIIAQAAVEEPTLIVIAGDLCDERHFYDSAPFKEAVDFVRRMAEIAPVFILKGTTNHDGYDIDIFAELSTRHPVCVADRIDCIGFSGGRFGPVKSFSSLDAVILAMPPVDKSNLLAYANSNMEESRLDTIDLMRDVLMAWGETVHTAKEAGTPVIFVGHLTVTGSQLSTGQQMIGRDLEVGLGDLKMTNADAVMLGHIHKSQHWGNVFYCGSVARLNYGEKEEKGFWLHNFTPDGLQSNFVVVPTKEMVTVNFDAAPDISLISEIPVDGKVRVRYRVKEEDVHSVDEKAIERQLMELGASEVKIEKTVIPIARVRAEGISKAGSDREKLEKWAETIGTVLSEGVFDKLELVEMEEDSRQYPGKSSDIAFDKPEIVGTDNDLTAGLVRAMKTSDDARYEQIAKSQEMALF